MAAARRNPAAPKTRGELFVVSAPSGAGKTTLLRRLLRRLPDLGFSVSYTTRCRRRGERDGVDYHFIPEAEFRRMVRRREFLEWAQVYDHRYGTHRSQVEAIRASGRDVLLDLDTQGAASVRRRVRDAILVFILPPDADTLARRLRGRGLDSAAAVRRRLAKAAAEIARYPRYDYLVVNDRVEAAVGRLEAVVIGRRHRLARRRAEARRILASFDGSKKGRK